MYLFAIIYMEAVTVETAFKCGLSGLCRIHHVFGCVQSIRRGQLETYKGIISLDFSVVR